MPAPLLSAIVVHWRNESELATLVSAWPDDPRLELIVVDNGSDRPVPAGGFERLTPGRNLGFAGGANAGAAAARGEILLILNPDAHPEPGALDRLLEGFEALPDAAGIAPALVGLDGASQRTWQLRRLPTAARLVLETIGLARAFARGDGGEEANGPGSPVEQPAAAALALRREAFSAIGGFDAAFYPAWFEDVDLARRLHDAGLVLRTWPAARFRHVLGASVPRLGYGRFLWIYDRNRDRYLGKHHGPAWRALARATLAFGLLLRLALLPLRRPRRAASRRDALGGLLAALAGVATGWRRPIALARAFAPPTPEGAA